MRSKRDRPELSHEEVWRRYDAIEDRLTVAISERMLDLAELQPGMRVLDLATGRGQPALGAAERVGSSAYVLGVDLSEGLLEMAREKAASAGLANVELRAADATLFDPPRPRDFGAVTIRWGLMYMKNPVAALTVARRALASDGVLVAAFWAEPERVPYYTLPMRLLEPYSALPTIDPEAPGTFRYADLSRITRDFGAAGFEIDHVEEIEIPVFEAETSDEVVDWFRVIALAPLLRGISAADEAAWERKVVSALEQTRSGDKIQVGGVTRIVRARPI